MYYDVMNLQHECDIEFLHIFLHLMDDLYLLTILNVPHL